MKIIIKKLLLFLITCIFIFIVFINLDFKELLNEIKHFDLKYIILLVASIITSLSFRGLLFKQIIEKTVKIPLLESIELVLTCASLNIVLPARAGDLFRAYFIGNKYHIDKIKIFGSVMFERIFDIIIIFCFQTIGIFLFTRNKLAVNLCLISGIILITSITFILISYKYKWTDKICSCLSKLISHNNSAQSIDNSQNITCPRKFHDKKGEQLYGSDEQAQGCDTKLNHTFCFNSLIKKSLNCVNNLCNSFIMGFEIIDSPKQIIYSIISAAFIWFFECLNFFIVIQGFNCDIHWSVTIFLICFIALSCMIPSTSIFIGPYQVAVISAFAIYNVSKETALAIALVEQTTITITSSIFATIFLLKNHINYKDISKRNFD